MGNFDSIQPATVVGNDAGRDLPHGHRLQQVPGQVKVGARASEFRPPIGVENQHQPPTIMSG